MNTKQEWFNNLRAVATIAVIVIHVSSNVLINYNKIAFSNWIFALTFSSFARFSVPIFFMLSGALLLQKDYSISQFINKRFIKIIPPFLFWSVVYVFYDAFIVGHKTYTPFQFLKLIGLKLANDNQYHLWFVYTLLGLYLFIPIIRKWVKNSNKNEIGYFLIIWLVTFLYSLPLINTYLPKIVLSSFAGYLGYMVLGYYLTQYNFNKKYALMSALFGLILIITGTFYTAKNNASLSNNYFTNNLNFPIFFYATGVFLLFKNIEFKSQILQKTINFISDYSFGIYLVHVLIIKILNRYDINWKMMHPALSIPITVIICLSLSIILAYISRKIYLIIVPITNKFLWNKKLNA